jgi:hypothetical protein
MAARPVYAQDARKASAAPDSKNTAGHGYEDSRRAGTDDPVGRCPDNWEKRRSKAWRSQQSIIDCRCTDHRRVHARFGPGRSEGRHGKARRSFKEQVTAAEEGPFLFRFDIAISGDVSVIPFGCCGE